MQRKSNFDIPEFYFEQNTDQKESQRLLNSAMLILKVVMLLGNTAFKTLFL